ncbi:hypothetical protein B0H19DRAFT_1123925 [Mycena capillaripes]|nr:hypothetical protein B0H19DRAFT_1123925 [Mycena capillaripes]
MALCPLRWGCRSRCLLLCLGLCPQVSLNTTIKLHFGGVRTKETTGYDVYMHYCDIRGRIGTGYDVYLHFGLRGHFRDKRLIVLETLNPTLLQ